MVYPSSSAIRAFGSITLQILKWDFSQTLYSFTFHRTCCLSRKLQSSSCYSSSGIWSRYISFILAIPIERFRLSLLYVWVDVHAKLLEERNASYKTAQDAKKTKLYSKIGKEVVSAVKKGGASPVPNTALAALFEKAKELDVPKEIIERNIKRASEKGQEAYIEKVYEVYGYGGVGIIVEVLTDKINRSVAAVREIVKDCGGKMADPESISFKFKRARVVNVKVTDADRYQIFLLLWMLVLMMSLNP